MAWVLGMTPTSRQLSVAKRWYAARSCATSAWPPSAASGSGSWRSSRSGSTVSTGGCGGSGGAGCQKRSTSGVGWASSLSASWVPAADDNVRSGGSSTGPSTRSSRNRPSSASRSRPRQRKIRNGSSSNASASR